jgi:hypothetical protein
MCLLFQLGFFIGTGEKSSTCYFTHAFAYEGGAHLPELFQESPKTESVLLKRTKHDDRFIWKMGVFDSDADSSNIIDYSTRV